MKLKKMIMSCLLLNLIVSLKPLNAAELAKSCETICKCKLEGHGASFYSYGVISADGEYIRISNYSSSSSWDKAFLMRECIAEIKKDESCTI